MIKNIFNNKKGRVQKLILIILIAFAIFIIPLGIYASENTTNVDDISVSEQPLEETVDDIVVVEESLEKVSNKTTVEEPVNETVVEESSANESSNETESLDGGGGEAGGQIQTANLEVKILYPKEITRGESITLTTVITNTGDLEINHVSINWTVPSGFEILLINQEDFEILLPGDSFESEIHLETSSSTLSGINEIKLGVNY